DHNWNGFYVGGNLSGGISHVRALGGSGTLSLGSEEGIRGTGFGGGVQAGNNYLIMSNYFVGVEGDIGWLGILGSERDWNDTVTFSNKTTWYGTLRGRVGTTTGPALLYFTGGGAWVHLTDTFALVGATSMTSRTQGGWTVGGGTEVAINSVWSAKFEAL